MLDWIVDALILTLPGKVLISCLLILAAIILICVMTWLW
jgi:hypothetical protein